MAVIHCFQVRLELQAEIKRQRAEGHSHRQPEVTTKHGKLKPHRKSKPQPMYLDDLAAMDILSEVRNGNLCT
jgi:myosin-3